MFLSTWKPCIWSFLLCQVVVIRVKLRWVAYRILATAPVPLGLIGSLNWVGQGLRWS